MNEEACVASIFDFPSRRAWTGLALAAIVAYGAFAALDFKIRLLPILIFAAISMAFGAAGYAYLRLRPHARLFAMFMGLAYFTAITFTVGVLDFALTPFGGPLWDTQIAAFERSLGIDWPTL